MGRSGLVMWAGGLRVLVAGLIGGALVLSIAVRPAVAPAQHLFQGWLTTQNSARISGASLEVKSAHGTLRLPPELAPPAHRAWHLSEDPGLTVEGRVERGQVHIDRVIADYVPARADARGGSATAVLVPDHPTQRCEPGVWSPATAEITYEGGDGPVKVSAAGRYAITGQFGPLGAPCPGASRAAQMDGAILVVSAADGPMP